MQTFDGIAIELLKHGFRRCLVIELHCHEHGDFRVGDSAIFADVYPCPECHAPCEYTVLCCEITKRDLPYSELVFDHIAPWQRQASRRSARRRTPSLAVSA